MKISQSHASFVALSLLLTACGEGAIPFKEIEVGRYEIKIGTELPSGDASAPTSYAVEESETSATDTSIEDLLDSEFGDATNPDGTNTSDASDSSSTSDDDKIASSGSSSGSGAGGSSAGSAGGAKAAAGSTAEDKETARLCGKIFAGKAAKVVVVSPNSTSDQVALDPNTVLAARLSGNQQRLALNISGVERMAGVCIIATGNQPKVTLVSDVDVGKLVYIGRGNQSQASFLFANEHALESSYIELKGNEHTVAMSGVEASHCDSATIRGNAGNSIVCK